MKRRGFTIIELMIVVAIPGILAAIAIPKFEQLASKQQGRNSSHRANVAHSSN